MAALSEENPPAAAIYLDYGADSSSCDEADFRVCDQGICFKSRWQFVPGTQLAMVLSCPAADGRTGRVDAEVTVASCEPAGERCYEVIALFVDVPDDLQQAIRNVSEHLVRRPKVTTVLRS
jgi:hypothetical protein